MVREGFSEEEVFKGAIGEAEEAATTAWGGENFKQRESGSTALSQEPPLSPRSISPGPGPGKGQVGPGHPFLWLCLLRGRVPGFQVPESRLASPSVPWPISSNWLVAT